MAMKSKRFNQPAALLTPTRPRSQTTMVREWPKLLIGAVCIFLLTTPFTFTLIGQDPTVVAAIDIKSMRNEANSQFLLYVVRFGILAIALLFAMQRWREVTRNVSRLLPIVPFVVWAALSIAWADDSAVPAHNVAALIALIAIAYCFVHAFAPQDLARIVVLGGAMMGICSVFYVVLLPSYGVHQFNDAIQAVHAGAWRGTYTHKNFLGHIAATFAAATFWIDPRLVRSRLWKWSIFAGLVAITILTTSASAPLLTPLAIALTWLMIVARPTERLRALIIGVPTLMIGSIATPLILQMIGRDQSFSGRSIVWQIAYDSFVQRPLAGFGYVSITFGNFSYRLMRSTSLIDPHNGYFDTVLGTGVIGLGLLIFAMIVAGRGARGLYLQDGGERQAGLVMFNLLICWIISCVTESSDRPFTPMGGLGLFAMATLLALTARRLSVAPVRGRAPALARVQLRAR